MKPKDYPEVFWMELDNAMDPGNEHDPYMKDLYEQGGSVAAEIGTDKPRVKTYKELKKLWE